MGKKFSSQRVPTFLQCQIKLKKYLNSREHCTLKFCFEFFLCYSFASFNALFAPKTLKWKLPKNLHCSSSLLTEKDLIWLPSFFFTLSTSRLYYYSLRFFALDPKCAFCSATLVTVLYKPKLIFSLSSISVIFSGSNFTISRLNFVLLFLILWIVIFFWLQAWEWYISRKNRALVFCRQ